MLKNIDFQNENRHWKIEFNRTRMLHLRGECGIGKSLFAKDLKAQKDHIANFSNILVINTEDAGSIYLLRPDTIHAYDLVVIDNADVLITKDIDDMIWRDVIQGENTHWIIIGRRYFDCCGFMLCQGNLKRRKYRNKYTFKVNYHEAILD